MVSKAFALWMGLWTGFGACLGLAQVMPEWQSGGDVPPPPEFAVRDETDFLGRDSGAKRRISDRLRQLEAQHGYRIYLVIEPVLIGSSAPELAEELRAVWLPQGSGLVVVFEANTRALGVGQDLAAGIDLDQPEAGIPNHEVSAVITRAIAASGSPKSDPAGFIETLTIGIADGIADYYRRRAAPPPAERALRMNLLIVGGLALLTLGALLVAHFTRRDKQAGPSAYQFPASNRPERLGAPFGGGNIASRSFADEPGPDAPVR